MSDIKELPTVEEAGVIAVEISENLHDKLEAREQAFFIAGFQEAIKYLMANKQKETSNYDRKNWSPVRSGTGGHVY